MLSHVEPHEVNVRPVIVPNRDVTPKVPSVLPLTVEALHVTSSAPVSLAVLPAASCPERTVPDGYWFPAAHGSSLTLHRVVLNVADAVLAPMNAMATIEATTATPISLNGFI